jgi:hypothetical protein
MSLRPPTRPASQHPSSQHPPDGDDGAPSGELRAFVLARVGGHSWVVDLIPNYELAVGRAADADIHIEGPEVGVKHATLDWSGRDVTVKPRDGRVEINGEPLDGPLTIAPGDELRIGPATLVVSITVAPVRKGRRSLTHREFCERVAEELSRAGRAGRPTCLVMVKSKSGDGSSVAGAALGSFREGDIVGTYAHDEIEFLLPDTSLGVAKAVIERLVATSTSGTTSIGIAIAPEDGDGDERLMRSARDALAKAVAQGGGFARAGEVGVEEASTGSVRTEATRDLIDRLTRASSSDDPVLLVGEPNTGRRYYARLFHDKSTRKQGPFVTVQCAGLVDAASLAEAFGKNGSVAGSTAESARGGTLVLDEIGDLPLQGQKRLLALFEEGSGDYNVVATTHRDLSSLAEVGAFLPELKDKLGVRAMRVPALRMRTDSIVPLAKNFAKQFKSDKPVKLSPGAIDKMRMYAWPGNVLELRNAIERAVALADGGEILAEHLPGDATDAGEGRLREHVGSVERDAIVKALADNNYNQTHAAKLLGISRRALIYKMEKYGLKPPPAGTRKDS